MKPEQPMRSVLRWWRDDAGIGWALLECDHTEPLRSEIANAQRCRECLPVRVVQHREDGVA